MNIEIKELALLCSKNDLKIKLNDVYLDVLSMAWDIFETELEYEDFKNDIKNEILKRGFKEIDEAVSFDEIIDIFDNTVEDFHESILKIRHSCVCEHCREFNEEDGPVYMGPGTIVDDEEFDDEEIDDDDKK